MQVRAVALERLQVPPLQGLWGCFLGLWSIPFPAFLGPQSSGGCRPQAWISALAGALGAHWVYSCPYRQRPLGMLRGLLWAPCPPLPPTPSVSPASTLGEAPPHYWPCDHK